MKNNFEPIVLFSTLFGVASGLVAVFTLNVYWGIGILAACVITTIVLILICKKQGFKKPNGVLWPCDEEENMQCSNLSRQVFGRVEGVSAKVSLKWHERNKYSCIAILHDDAIAGFVEILPLRSGAIDRLTKGSIREDSISPDDILRIEDRASTEYLYITGIVAQRLMDIPNNEYTILLYSALRVMEKLYDIGKIKAVVALAVTDAGRIALKKCGFAKGFVFDKETRYSVLYEKVEYEIYSLKPNRKMIADILKRITKSKSVTHISAYLDSIEDKISLF